MRVRWCVCGCVWVVPAGGAGGAGFGLFIMGVANLIKSAPRLLSTVAVSTGVSWAASLLCLLDSSSSQASVFATSARSVSRSSSVMWAYLSS